MENIDMQPAALKMLRKCCQTWPDQADKNFQGRTKVFNIIAENFCSRIKIFGGTIFFLTGPIRKRHILKLDGPWTHSFNMWGALS